MEQSFSHGLLYSVAPENLSELHLQDESANGNFEWEEQDSLIRTLIRIVFARLKTHS